MSFVSDEQLIVQPPALEAASSNIKVNSVKDYEDEIEAQEVQNANLSDEDQQLSVELMDEELSVVD